MKNWCKEKKYFGQKKIEDHSDENKNRLHNLTQRFNRWHDKQIALLTFGINLFFTIGIASIGFILNYLDTNLFHKTLLCNYILGKTVLLIIFISIIFGIIALIVRLNDFKITKNVVRFKKLKYNVEHNLKYQSCEEYDITELKKKIKKCQKLSLILGDITWIFFYFQIGIYLLAILLLLIYI
ncbi:MAG: hypothetical protein ABII90_06985 [Bacteroidota bacterium]